MVEFSTEESAAKLSLGLRESGMVSTGWSAVSPEMLEDELCAVTPRGRRMPDVRRGDRCVEGGNDVAVDSPGGGSGAGEGMDSAVSCCWYVSHEIGEIRRKLGNGRHGAVSRIEGERRGGRRGRARRARPLLPTPQTNRLNKEANPWSSG